MGEAGLWFCLAGVGFTMFKLGLFRTPNVAVFEWGLGLVFLSWIGIIVLFLRKSVSVPFGWSYESFRELLRRTGKNPHAFTRFDKRFFFFSGCVFVGLIIYDAVAGSGFLLPPQVIIFCWILVVVLRESMKKSQEKWGKSPFVNGRYYSQLDRDVENIKRLWNTCLYKVVDFLRNRELK